MTDTKKLHNTIYWFRKALRLHDNPALIAACQDSRSLYPVFILDPWFVKNGRVGVNRWRFLQQTLTDLDSNLRKVNSRLYVIRGKPEDVLEKFFKEWNVDRLAFEIDSEPYAVERDDRIESVAKRLGVEVVKRVSHTLYDLEKTIHKNGGRPPLTYQAMQSLLNKMGPPPKPAPTLSHAHLKDLETSNITEEEHRVPTLSELGVTDAKLHPCKFPGGETEALDRMEKHLKRVGWVCSFEKPKTSPNSLDPSTTVLSPYLKFGSLSARTFYYKLKDLYAENKKHTQPPVSLEGQLFWREFFYTVAAGTPNFDRMEGNPVCRQIPWSHNPEHLQAWKNGQTGYPFIDAVMTQLRQEGWIHHLGRHAVACFLTRGDLWISWEEGQKVFEELLLDADWSLNAANWMWLSASAFFHQYFRVYSPIAFGKKTDKNGEFIKKYLPQLKKFPAEYIYEPWTAPKSLQEKAGCIIGKDYPKPIVNHAEIHKINIQKMAKAYADSKSNAAKSPAKSTKKRESSGKASGTKKKKMTE